MKIKRAIGASVATGSPIAITGTVGYMEWWLVYNIKRFLYPWIHLCASILGISIACSVAVSYGAHRFHSLPKAYFEKDIRLNLSDFEYKGANTVCLILSEEHAYSLRVF